MFNEVGLGSSNVLKQESSLRQNSVLKQNSILKQGSVFDTSFNYSSDFVKVADFNLKLNDDSGGLFGVDIRKRGICYWS